MISPSTLVGALASIASLALFHSVTACSDGAGDSPAPNGGNGGTGATDSTIQTVGSGAMGGMGGDGSGAAAGSGNGGDGAGGEGGAGEPTCEDMCDRLENECQQPTLCGPPNQGYLFSCEDPANKVCLLECFDDHSCGEISAFLSNASAPSMKACVGQCDNALICKQCIVDPGFPNNCVPEATACADDAACNAWVGCAAGCSDAACFDACDTAHPGGAPLDTLYACICEASKCGEWCGDTLTCPGP
jgi:hypothetical protein